METTPEDSAAISPATLNSRTAALMFCVEAATCLGLVALAETPWVKDAIRDAAWVQATWKKQIPWFSFTREFLSNTDRLIYEELPATDFSRGGVYLVGASNVVWTVKLWDLSPEIRPWFHNIALGGGNQSDQFEMIRFLVEQRGLLEAGGPRTLMMFGVSYHSCHNARIPGRETSKIARSSWERHGIYSVDDDGTIRRTSCSPLYEAIVLERHKMTGLMKELVNLGYTPFKPVRVHNPKFSTGERTRDLGDEWRQKIDFEVATFARTADYLRERGARVIVVRMPQPSWDHDSPFENAYIGGLRKVCQDRGIPVYDFSRLLTDDQFADSIHLTTEGMAEFGAKVVEIGVGHLRSIGALSPDQPARNP